MFFTPLPGTPFTDCDPRFESLWCCVIVRKGVSFDIFFFPHQMCKTFEIYLEEREREHLVKLILEYIATTFGNDVAMESRSTAIGRMGM